MGTILFYLLWPLIWFYAPLRIRVRVILRHDQDVLVVKNWFGPDSWQLPGGGRKTGESVSATAVREIKEELAVVIDQDRIEILTIDPVVFKSKGLLYRYQYVLYELSTKPLIKASHEITSVSWKKIADLAIPDQLRSKL